MLHTKIVFLHFLKDGEIQKSFKIEGGGGSSSDTTTITIERITNADAIFLLGSKAIIEYSFSSVDNTGDTTGAGTAVWKLVILCSYEYGCARKQ